jgi:putative ABC transport system permease protein
MIRNHLTIAWRNLVRHKIQALINIGGLALGLASFLLILQYVSLEKSVNRFHTNLPQLYRVLCQNPDGNNWPEVEPGWADQIKARLPEVKSYCRVAEGVGQGIVQNPLNQQAALEQNILYVESNFFQFFNFPLIEGKATELTQPNTCFMSEDASKKYFSNADPLGKTISLNNQFGTHLYTVKGIFKNIGDQSDIRAEIVFSLETLKNKANLSDNGWAYLDNLDSQYILMFLELQKGADYLSVEKKLTTLRRELQTEKDAVVFRLQPLADMHLGGASDKSLQQSGNRQYVWTLSCIAFMILLIAWFNFVNLSTANAFKRANEVGVRKVIGANRQDLMGLFMTESILVNILAWGGGIILVALLQAPFNELIGKKLEFSSLFLNPIWISGLALIMLGSFISGLYTALSLTHFQPIQTLKGKIVKSSGGALLRKSLVVIQFSISVALIISTILVFDQLKYMQDKNLGTQLNQMLFVLSPKVGIDHTINQRKSAYYNEIAALSYVKDYCTSNSVPGKGYNFATAGFTSPKSKSGDETKSYSFAIVGEKYLPVYEIPLVAGRNFTQAETMVEWNDNDKVILNEKAVHHLGYENVSEILQDKIKWDERYLQVIGVIRDYHHEGLQSEIKPMIFYPSQGADLSIKLTTNNIKDNVASIEKIFKKYFPGNPFTYFFMDEWFNKQYASEMQFRKLFTAAAMLAVFIACLGLFGLSVYTVESRTKEIGIRKVLGASVAGVTTLLSKDFTKLVLIGIVVASPVAYIFMDKWLASFAYKIEIEWWVFVLAGIIALGIALLTISFQSIKAAIANPIKSLRTE